MPDLPELPARLELGEGLGGAVIAAGFAVWNHPESGATAAEVEKAVAACARQLAEDFCPDYSRLPIEVTVYAKKSEIPAGKPTAVIAARSDVPGALAYHSEDTDGRVTILVGVLTCRENGEEWSSALSHELLEAAFDPFVNKYATDLTGKRQMACEVADPVQDKTYEIDGVTVSSYVLPDWFNDQPGPGAKFDKLGDLSAPFTRTEGGYFMYLDQRGRSVQDGMRRPTAAPDGRASRRPAAPKHAALEDVTAKEMIATAREMGASVAAVVNDVAQRARRAAA